jgi:hypothetical protein
MGERKPRDLRGLALSKRSTLATSALAMPCSQSQPLICSGDQRIWRNFASILRRNGAVSLRGLLRIAWVVESTSPEPVLVGHFLRYGRIIKSLTLNLIALQQWK